MKWEQTPPNFDDYDPSKIDAMKLAPVQHMPAALRVGKVNDGGVETPSRPKSEAGSVAAPPSTTSTRKQQQHPEKGLENPCVDCFTQFLKRRVYYEKIGDPT